MSIDQIRHKLEQLVRPHLPMIQSMVQQAAQQSGQKVSAFLQNDDAMRLVLGRVHSRLPRVVRFVVREEKFVRFVLNNRDNFFAREDERFRG